MFICVSLLFSCKSDPKETTIENDSVSEKVEEVVYSKRTRKIDSLKMVEKMTKVYGEVDEQEIIKMLDQNAEKAKTKKVNNTIAKGRGGAEKTMPSVCSVFTPEEIADLFEVDVAEVKEASGNKGTVPNDKSRSCFWRWSTTGIMLQVSTNPLPEEVDDWCTRYINTKKSSGEKAVSSPGKQFTYVDFDGPGTENIYNEGLGRYYVTQEEEYIISLVFNGNIGKSKQRKAAKKILDKMYKNL